MAVLTEAEQKYLRERLHSDAMHCRQCVLVAALLKADEEASSE